MVSQDVYVESPQRNGRVLLQLGQVAATAEVHVNGQLVGVKVAPPWAIDISKFVKPGENRIEILVYNTLANHYGTIPTIYRGSPLSGLIGPVRIESSLPTTLTTTTKNDIWSGGVFMTRLPSLRSFCGVCVLLLGPIQDCRLRTPSTATFQSDGG